MNTRHIIAAAIGGVEALLLARLVLRLLAARPDNPVVGTLFAMTALPEMLMFLDRGQPRFGATLEFSTLALILLIAVLGLMLARASRVRVSKR